MRYNIKKSFFRTEPTITTDCEANKDIEDIITNYHIQVPINRTKVIEQDETKKNEENEEIEDLITNFHIKQNQNLNGEENSHIIDVDNLKDPVFIEVSVDKGLFFLLNHALSQVAGKRDVVLRHSVPSSHI